MSYANIGENMVRIAVSVQIGESYIEGAFNMPYPTDPTKLRERLERLAASTLDGLLKQSGDEAVS